MPSPSPLVAEYQKPNGARRTYRIEAWGTGFFRVLLDGRVVHTGGDPLLVLTDPRPEPAQVAAEAMARAKRQIDTMAPGGDW